MARVGASFIDDLAPPERAAMERLGITRRFRRDAAILLEGDRTDQVILLRTGRVKIINSGSDGREFLVAVRGPGELVGELTALTGDGAPRAATVIALDDVTAQVVQARDLLGFLRRQPDAALVLLRQLAGRLRESSARHVDAGAYGSQQRVARALVELAEREGEVVDTGVRVAVGLTQEDLAGLVASSRETVARALGVLRRQELIATDRRAIVVRDLERLRRVAS